MEPFPGTVGISQLTGRKKLAEILVHCVGVRKRKANFFTLPMEKQINKHPTMALDFTYLLLCCISAAKRVMEDLYPKGLSKVLKDFSDTLKTYNCISQAPEKSSPKSMYVSTARLTL